MILPCLSVSKSQRPKEGMTESSKETMLLDEEQFSSCGRGATEVTTIRNEVEAT